MLNWLSQNSNALQVLTSFGTLLVWIFYAQLLLGGFLRQRRSRVSVNQGQGQDLDAEVMISNMSHEPVLLLSVQAVMETEEGEFVRTITNVRSYDEGGHSGGQTREVIGAGPLGSGAYMILGTFQQVADWASPGSEAQRWRRLGIRVIFIYGSEDYPLCAYRYFGFVDGEDVRKIHPESLDTVQLRSRRHRGRIRRWLQESL